MARKLRQELSTIFEDAGVAHAGVAASNGLSVHGSSGIVRLLHAIDGALHSPLMDGGRYCLAVLAVERLAGNDIGDRLTSRRNIGRVKDGLRIQAW